MTSRVVTDFNFITGVYYFDELLMHQYSLSCFMLPTARSSFDTTIALARVDFLIEQMKNSIWVHQEETDIITNLSSCNIPVIVMPCVPDPEVINVALYYKIDAITEDKIELFETELICNTASNIKYLFSDEDYQDIFNEHGWWHKSHPRFDNQYQELPEIHNLVTWNDFGLIWEDNQNFNKSENNIIQFKK